MNINTKQQKRPTKRNVVTQQATVFERFNGIMDKDISYEVHIPSENEEDWMDVPTLKKKKKTTSMATCISSTIDFVSNINAPSSPPLTNINTTSSTQPININTPSSPPLFTFNNSHERSIY